MESRERERERGISPTKWLPTSMWGDLIVVLVIWRPLMRWMMRWIILCYR